MCVGCSAKPRQISGVIENEETPRAAFRNTSTLCHSDEGGLDGALRVRGGVEFVLIRGEVQCPVTCVVDRSRLPLARLRRWLRSHHR